MMYRFLSCIFALLFISCNDRFVRKEINNNDITVSWYYYSYISDNSPDYVTVRKGAEEKNIYEAVASITDVNLHDSTIIISTLGSLMKGVITKDLPQEIYGYRIVYDTVSDPSVIYHLPKGIKK